MDLKKLRIRWIRLVLGVEVEGKEKLEKRKNVNSFPTSTFNDESIFKTRAKAFLT